MNVLQGVVLVEQVAGALLRLYRLVAGDPNPAASLHAIASIEELRRKSDAMTKTALDKKFGPETEPGRGPRG